MIKSQKEGSQAHTTAAPQWRELPDCMDAQIGDQCIFAKVDSNPSPDDVGNRPGSPGWSKVQDSSGERLINRNRSLYRVLREIPHRRHRPKVANGYRILDPTEVLQEGDEMRWLTEPPTDDFGFLDIDEHDDIRLAPFYRSTVATIREILLQEPGAVSSMNCFKDGTCESRDFLVTGVEFRRRVSK